MREKAILDLLSKNKYVKLDAMAKAIGVSTRTIRNDLQLLSEEAGFTIASSRGVGYYLEIHDERKYQKYLEAIDGTEIEMQDSRLDSILVLFLITDEYQIVQQFSDIFSISPSQIKKDLHKLDEYLEGTPLSLERKAHYGIRLIGDLQSRVSLLLDKYQRSNQKLIELINVHLSEEQRKSLKQAIYQELKQKALNLDYIELQLFEVEMMLVIMMAQKRQLPTSKSEPSVIQNILAQAEIKVLLNQAETEYLLNSLRAKTKTLKLKNVNKEVLKSELERFFKDMDHNYQTRFSEDHEFLNLLYLHVSSLIERSRKDLSLSNPYVEEISQSYPNVFNLALIFAKWLEERYQLAICQDEIAFLATHMVVPFERQNQQMIDTIYRIAVVCSSGGGMAYLIELRLKRIFPKAKIQTFSMFELEKIETFYPDLVFSITELSLDVNCPVILIDEIQDELDYLELRENIQFINQKGKSPDVEEVFLSLLSDQYFRIEQHTDYGKLLRAMAEQIEEQDAPNGYADSLMEREQFLSTVYQNGVAIPHPIEMHGKRNLLSTCILPQGAASKKEPWIVFMVSLKENQLDLHRLISKYLGKLMSNSHAVDLLTGCGDYQEFQYTLRKILGGK